MSVLGKLLFMNEAVGRDEPQIANPLKDISLWRDVLMSSKSSTFGLQVTGLELQQLYLKDQ